MSRLLSVAQQSSPLPNRQVITTANAGEIVELGRLGRGDIVGIEWSPIDAFILAVAMTSGIRLYDVTQPEVLPYILPYEGWTLTSLVFSSDGRWIAAGDESGFVYLWDVQARQLELSFQAHDIAVRRVAFNPDQTLIASVGGQEVRLWDVQSGDFKDSLRHNNDVLSIAFSPDGTQLATATQDGLLRLWNIPMRQAWSAKYLDTWIVALIFTPDGHLISSGVVTNTGEVNTQIHSIIDGVLGGKAPRRLDIQVRYPVNTVLTNIGLVVSVDGRYLFTTSNHTSIWEIETSQMVRENLTISDPGSYLALSPNRATLAVARSGSAVLLQLGVSSEESTIIPTLLPTPVATAVSVLSYVDLPGITELIRDDATITGLTFSDETSTLYASYHNTRFMMQWELQLSSIKDASLNPMVLTNRQLCFDDVQCTPYNIEKHHENLAASATTSISSDIAPQFSPDGSLVAVVQERGSIVLYDALSGAQLAVLMGHDGNVGYIEFSPDGTLIVSAVTRDRVIHVWGIPTSK